jgi:hypothetical protein
MVPLVPDGAPPGFLRAPVRTRRLLSKSGYTPLCFLNRKNICSPVNAAIDIRRFKTPPITKAQATPAPQDATQNKSGRFFDEDILLYFFWVLLSLIGARP